MLSSRRKSCVSCVKAKRRCDLGLPACHRCATRRSKCVYPWAETGQPAETSLARSTFELELGEQALLSLAPANSQPLLGPGKPGGTNLGPASPAIPQPLSPGTSALIDEVMNYTGAEVYGSIPDTQSYTPAVVHQLLPPSPLNELDSGPITTGGIYQARTEYAARRLGSQPRTFVDTGQTAFIHHTHTAASSALQEAFAASALHALQNTINAQLVNSEIERRASLLITVVESGISSSPISEVDLLAPAQALIVYQCLRLFSSNIRQRAQAERDEAHLLSWVSRLRMQVRLFGDTGDWAHWVREESIRRTVLTAEVLCGTYAFLRQGWDKSEARVMSLGFTAQAALWDARSGAEWRAAWARGPKLEVVMRCWDTDMALALPDDAEELGIIIRATYTGLEALEEWLGGHKPRLVKWGLRQ